MAASSLSTFQQQLHEQQSKPPLQPLQLPNHHFETDAKLSAASTAAFDHALKSHVAKLQEEEGGSGAAPEGQAAYYLPSANKYRCKLCHTREITYDTQLELDAQAYADGCPSTHAGEAEKKGAAENLYYVAIKPENFDGLYGGGAITQAWDQAFEAWFNEVTQFDAAAFEYARHFIILTARTQTKMGCAFKVCDADLNNPKSPFFDVGGAVLVCRFLNEEGTWSDDVAHFNGKADRNDESCKAQESSLCLQNYE